MTRRPLHIGAVLRRDGRDVEVTSYRIDGTSQVVTARDDAGGQHTLLIDLSGPDGDEVEAIDVTTARRLALSVLGQGEIVRLPVGRVERLLAEAVVALTGGAPCRG